MPDYPTLIPQTSTSTASFAMPAFIATLEAHLRGFLHLLRPNCTRRA